MANAEVRASYVPPPKTEKAAGYPINAILMS